VNLWRFTSFRASFQSLSNFSKLFFNSPFICVRWASLSFLQWKNEEILMNTWINLEVRTKILKSFSGRLKTENKSVTSSSSSLIRSLLQFLFFSPSNPSWSHNVLELRRYELGDEGSWRISESSWQFRLICTIICWIKLCIDTNLMNFEDLGNG
jgi:hypothetical protein